ncbi:hypothetical protein L2E82_48519 [Cichorium intybus]|uniref:Uncharacterized protein n=1 Tax=Cichorium intybus TaxID=13427 RepID=A0ACB8YY92_CICIN|nr:hypothetical protein L2E82_48519 [Cichorium intybus]
MIQSTLGALFETCSFDYVYLEAVVSIRKQEGIKGYWKGNLAQVLRILPYSAVQQFAYESYKKLYAGKDGELSVSGRLAADASAGMTSTFVIGEDIEKRVPMCRGVSGYGAELSPVDITKKNCEALSIAKTNPQKITLHSNRTACFLKLHHFKKKCKGEFERIEASSDSKKGVRVWKKHYSNLLSLQDRIPLGMGVVSVSSSAARTLFGLSFQGSKDTQEHYWLGAVHVKDVAEPQVVLFETPTASDRYLCTNGIFQFGDFAQRVSKLFPDLGVHSETMFKL